MAAKKENKTEIESHSVIIERTLEAPVEVVWKALTDIEEIKRWYFGIAEFKPVAGFSFQFTGGKDDRIFLHLCTITEVIPRKKLAYTWRYDGYEGTSLVTFELFPEGNTTRVRLTHEGVETFPANDPDFAKDNFVEGWTYIIGKGLKEFVEPKAEEGDISAREIVTTRLINAPRELVWKVWTEPDHIAKWWGPNGFTNTIDEMTVKPGGAWRFMMHGPDGKNYPNEIIFSEVVKPERLVYTHTAPKFYSTVTFEEQGGKTQLTMRMVFNTAKERDQVVKEFGALEGAIQTFTRLEEYLVTAKQ